jgi:alpha-amylase
VSSERRDTDMDGIDEVRLADAGQVVVIDLAEGAGIGSWDIRPVRHALAAVMRRRPEAYHAKLRALAKRDAGAASQRADGDVPLSIHETVRTKEPGLADLLVYDGYDRRSGLVRVLPIDATAEAWASARVSDLGDLADGPFEIDALESGRLVARRDATIGRARVRTTKTIELGGDRRVPTLTLTLDLEHDGGPDLDVRIGVEWSLTMLGGGGNPAAWWEVGGPRSPHDGRGSASGIDTIAQGNDDIGISVTTSTDSADAWWAPIETVSNSEDGFERVYQGSGLLLSWPVTLRQGERWSRTIVNTVDTTAADR